MYREYIIYINCINIGTCLYTQMDILSERRIEREYWEVIDKSYLRPIPANTLQGEKKRPGAQTPPPPHPIDRLYALPISWGPGPPPCLKTSVRQQQHPRLGENSDNSDPVRLPVTSLLCPRPPISRPGTTFHKTLVGIDTFRPRCLFPISRSGPWGAVDARHHFFRSGGGGGGGVQRGSLRGERVWGLPAFLQLLQVPSVYKQ
jgi:hypothetical protein